MRYAWGGIGIAGYVLWFALHVGWLPMEGASVKATTAAERTAYLAYATAAWAMSRTYRKEASR